MPDDSARNEPRALWQNQPTEPSALTLLLLAQKTRDLRAKTRREVLKSLSGTIGVIALGGYGLRLPDPILRAGFAFAMAWSIAGGFLFSRGLRPCALPGDAALLPSLKAYRDEVERRRRLFSRALQWLLAPVLLVISMWILAGFKMGILNRTTLPRATPFFTLLAVWLIAMLLIRLRQQRGLQRELDDLKEMERMNSAIPEEQE